MTAISNFTFLVLTYNHSKFILEHLESIKYLIDNYGKGIDIDIIIADDASRDDTFSLVESWLKENSRLFRKVTALSDGLNRGTCKNLTHALEYLTTDYCKITAGDDVYSCENLFAEVTHLDDKHILSGLPLTLIDGAILPTRFHLFNFFATNRIYEKSEYLKRLKRICFFNSPNIFYNVSALSEKTATDFVNRYFVTEDWPLQIIMAELYRPLKFVQIEKVLVYYRKSSSSVYVSNNYHFNRDKVGIFNYLINNEQNPFEKLLLRNRLYCYNIKNRYIKRVCNLSLHVYCFNILTSIFPILSKVVKFDAQLAKHQKHYDLIASRVNEFRRC